jgi:hypothetical protein
MSASITNEVSARLTWRDTLAYLLAYVLWIIWSGAAGMLMLVLRGALTPPLTILLLRNPYYLAHTVELRGTVNSLDRAALIVFAIIWVVYLIWLEEWLRGGVKLARERRLRATFSEAAQPLIETGLQRWSLDPLLRRAALAAIFPGAITVLYFILRGIFELLVRWR